MQKFKLSRFTKARRIAFYSVLFTSTVLSPLYPAIEIHAANYGALIPLPNIGASVAPVVKDINTFLSHFSNTSSGIPKPLPAPVATNTLAPEIQMPTPPKVMTQANPSGVSHPDFTTNGGGFGIYRSHLDTLGIFQPSSKAFNLNDANDGGAPYVSIPYGTGSGAIYPVTGDWNNDGVETIGVFNNGQFQLDSKCAF